MWWTPGYWSNLPLGRAAYVDHSGAVSTDYALDRPPAVSASGQIGYVNVRATFGPYDSETIAVQKMNMATGSVLWTVASSGGFASAALDDGGLFVSGTQSMKLAADGSVTSLGGRDNGLAAAMLGTVRIVSSGDSSQVLATVSDMSYASPSGYSLVRGNEGQRGAVRRPTFVYFCPNDLLSTVPPITCGDYAVSVRNQVRTGQLKTEPPRIYSVSAATADRFKTEVTEGSGDAIAFIGHGIFVQPYGAVGLEFADKDLVKPGFSGHHESNQIRVTTPLIPHAKVVFIAACEIAETFMSLWDISDTTTGRALIVAVGPSGDVDLHDASLAWDRIAVALADGSTITQAKDVANAWLAGIGNALRFQVAGDGNVKVK